MVHLLADENVARRSPDFNVLGTINDCDHQRLLIVRDCQSMIVSSTSLTRRPAFSEYSFETKLDRDYLTANLQWKLEFDEDLRQGPSL